MNAPGSDREKASHPGIRRWRRAFLALYLVITAAFSLWILFSLIVSVLGARPLPAKGPRITAAADDPRELGECLRRLERLLSELHKETFDLQARVLRYDIDPSAEWRNFSQMWRMRHNALDWRCRLSELGGRGVSPAVDRMAEIHAALDELQFSYTDVVHKFVDRYQGRLGALRRELTKVRKIIETKDPNGSDRGAAQPRPKPSAAPPPS